MSSLFTVPELAIGVGLSEAASAAFEPKVEVPKQTAWARNPQRVPELALIAELIAGGKVTMVDGQNMANRLGFSDGTMESLVWLAQNRLDFPVMLRLWRRFGAFDAGDDTTLSALFDKTIAHEQLDWDYRPWLRRLKTAELVGLGDIAMGIVRSALPAPAYVPVPAPTAGLSVPRFPQVDIDPETLAAAIGFSPEMLQLMVARSGLSLAPGLAATALFRKLINNNDFLLAIAEGDLRTEWADTLKDAMRDIPSPHAYVQQHLRGWTDLQGMHDGAARHGMVNADADVLYQIERRPLNVRAITTALARGGTFNPQAGELTDPYEAAVHQADLGPEWYDLAKANKYSYPSAFVLRALAQAGDLGGQPQVEQVLLEIGWKPSFATQVSTAWTGVATATDPYVTKAENQLWTAQHSSYVKDRSDDSFATATLSELGVAAGAIPAVLTLWQREREIVRSGLSPAQIKKAYGEATFTQPEAVARLVELGWSAADAGVYLGE